MNEKKQGLASALSLTAIVLVFAVLLFAVNIFAAPLIEKNNSAALLAPLFEAMPGAKGFEPIYTAAEPGASGLQDVPATVQDIYRETSDQGYALRLSTSEGYTKEPIEIIMAVDSLGRITGTTITAYPETKELGEFPLSFVGKDSALPDVGLVAGATYSSSAFKNAVSDGFTALIANGLVSEGVKSDEQLLTELIPVVFPGMANKAGVLQAEEVAAASAGAELGWKALNGSGFAYLVPNGESKSLVIVNAAGEAKAYDPEGKELSLDTAALVTLSQSLREDFSEAEIKALTRIAGEGSTAEPIALGGQFGTVTGAYLIRSGEQLCLGLAARPYGYSNMPLAVYYVLDADGAIVGMNADELILIKEYFSSYELDEPSYKAGFAGLTADSFTGEQALISGATVSSEAITTATEDVFAAFEALRGELEVEQ